VEPHIFKSSPKALMVKQLEINRVIIATPKKKLALMNQSSFCLLNKWTSGSIRTTPETKTASRSSFQIPVLTLLQLLMGKF